MLVQVFKVEARGVHKIFDIHFSVNIVACLKTNIFVSSQMQIFTYASAPIVFYFMDMFGPTCRNMLNSGYPLSSDKRFLAASSPCMYVKYESQTILICWK